MTAGRRIFGNLDCEAEFAASYWCSQDGHAAMPRTSLTRAAGDSAAALATLLRAFAGDGDRLWTPVPVAPERLAEVPGLPRPELESGPPASLAPCSRLLAWGETETVAALRAGSCPPRAEARGYPMAPEGREQVATGFNPWKDAGNPGKRNDLLWRLPAADPTVAAKVHHRGFALGVATSLGCALPGAALLASAADLERHLRTVVCDAWVVKAPFSAAGRRRHVVRGEPATADRRRIERLFTAHRELLFEPWLDRGDDFGIAGAISADGARRIGFHRSFTAPRGAFLGIELRAWDAGIHDLDDGEREHLEEVFAGVARALIGAGYRGPFGIDCWRYRRTSGELAFHPLGEINARMTLGIVARALVDRVREPLGIAPEATVRLRWDMGDPPAGAVPLLHRGDSPRSLAAWLWHGGAPYPDPGIGKSDSGSPRTA